MQTLDWTSTTYADGSKLGRHIHEDGSITYWHRSANGPWRKGLDGFVHEGSPLSIDISKVKWPQDLHVL